MIWIILFILIIAASAVLAFRSMRNFEDFPSDPKLYSLFLIKNKDQFNLSLLQKLHALMLHAGAFFSLEKLFKGNQNAMLIYGPKQLLLSQGELELVELEDYLADDFLEVESSKKINKNDSYAFLIEPKNNSKKNLITKNGFLKLLDLKENQYFFWQIICQPLKADFLSQVTIRGIAADKDLHQRVEFAKKVNSHIEEFTGLLIDQENQKISSSIFDSYKKRTLIPKEVSNFILDGGEILSLLG